MCFLISGIQSPLLSNIILHVLDTELEKQSHLYVRYADDFSNYTNSKQAARKVGNSTFLFLKNKLKLPINWEKSGIRKPGHFEILGYKFVPMYNKEDRGKYQLVVSEKSWNNLKQRLKSLTRKTSPMTFDERIRYFDLPSSNHVLQLSNQLNEVQRGWLNYFRLASLAGKLGTTDGWVSNRLRYCIWSRLSREKKPERKRKNLIRRMLS